MIGAGLLALALVATGVAVGLNRGSGGGKVSRDTASNSTAVPSSSADATNSPAVRSAGATASKISSAQPTAAAAASAYVPLSRRSWTGVRYNVNCSGQGIRIVAMHYGDLTRDGKAEALVDATCNAGAGTPPEWLFVFDGASPPGPPHLLARLFPPSSQFANYGKDLTIVNGEVFGTAYGYSSDSVPRCCPDLEGQVTWKWDGHHFVFLE